MQQSGTTNQDDLSLATGEQMHPIHRRALVGSMVAGFVLSASGLFLPDTAQETEAANAAHRGKLGGRHGNNHRGRDKRRHNGHRRQHNKEQGNGGGRSGTTGRGIEFVVGYNGPSQSINSKFYVVYEGGGSATTWQLTDQREITHASGADLMTTSPDAALWIADRYLVWAINPERWNPRVLLGYRGAIQHDGWISGVTVVYKLLNELQVAPQMRVEGHIFEVQRLQDSSDYKRFKVTIS